jgi:hypothetical protein
MRLKDSGIIPLLFLILYYRKSRCTIFSMNIGLEVALARPLQAMLERTPIAKNDLAR